MYICPNSESRKYLGPSPPHYVCHLCGQPGHHIQKCHMQLVIIMDLCRHNLCPLNHL